MTPQQILATALRLFAVWLIVKFSQNLITTPFLVKGLSQSDSYLWAPVIIIGVLMLLMAAMLWFFPLSIAYQLVPRASFGDPINLQPLEAARVGCALIGLWLFAEGIRGVAKYILIFTLAFPQNTGFTALPPNYKVEFFYTIFTLALGLVLMLRGTAFARLVVRGVKT